MNGAAAAGGRVSSTKPTITHHTNTGQFVISDYDASFQYVVTVSNGTVSRSGNIITVGDATATASIYYINGKVVSAVTTAARAPYTYHQEYGQTGWEYWWPPPYDGAESCGTWSNGDPWCRRPTYGWNTIKDAPPSGYTDSYGEYWKVA